jgi:hypothetical protein
MALNDTAVLIFRVGGSACAAAFALARAGKRTAFGVQALQPSGTRG